VFAIFILVADLGCGASSVHSRKRNGKSLTLQNEKAGDMASKIQKGLVALQPSLTGMSLLKLKQAGIGQCAEKNCGKPIAACAHDAKCKNAYACFQGCGSASALGCGGNCLVQNWDPAISSVYHCVTNDCVPTSQRAAGQCIMNNCKPQVQHCFADKGCGALLGCVEKCNNSVNCVYHCGTANWDSAINSVVNCAVQCATPPITLFNCVKQKCGKQVQGCLASNKCEGAFSCVKNCTGSLKADCVYDCITNGWGPALSSVVHCATVQCA